MDGHVLPRETLAAVTRREPAALGALFDAHFDRLYGLAYRLLGERAAAEDVTQEVFLKVYRSADQLDPDRDPGPWLRTITVNACREHWRKRSRRAEGRSVSLDESPGMAATVKNGRANPEQSAIAGERGERIMAALMQLTEPLRTVVVLHDYQGLDHPEIAELVGASATAVRKRYSRALAQLRELLEELE